MGDPLGCCQNGIEGEPVRVGSGTAAGAAAGNNELFVHGLTLLSFVLLIIYVG